MDWEYSRSSQISSLIFGGWSSSIISGLISVLKKVGLNSTSACDDEFMLADDDGVLEVDDVVDDDVEEDVLEDVLDWSRLYNKLLSGYDFWHICYLILAEFKTNGT